MNSEEEKGLVIEGRNPVMEALKSGAQIDRLIVKKGGTEGSIRRILGAAREMGIVIQQVPKEKLDKLSETGAHQGVIALCPAFPYAEITDIAERAGQSGEPPFIIILDGVEDPRNLGAVIRAAECAGAHGVIIPKRRACGVTAAVVKASAGACAHMPVCRVTNIVQTVKELQKRGVWVCAADMRGRPMYEAPLDGAIALVIGGEGGGVSRLVKETCDFTASVPLRGKTPSLNASVAAGALMYEVVRRRLGK